MSKSHPTVRRYEENSKHYTIVRKESRGVRASEGDGAINERLGTAALGSNKNIVITIIYTRAINKAISSDVRRYADPIHLVTLFVTPRAPTSLPAGNGSGGGWRRIWPGRVKHPTHYFGFFIFIFFITITVHTIVAHTLSLHTRGSFSLQYICVYKRVGRRQ